MSYNFRLIGKSAALLKDRINTVADAPEHLRTALAAAVDSIVVVDTSPSDYVVLVEASGDSAIDLIEGRFSVRRIEAIDNVVAPPVSPMTPTGALRLDGPTRAQYALSNPGAVYPPPGFAVAI